MPHYQIKVAWLKILIAMKIFELMTEQQRVLINVLRFGTPRDDGQANSARVKLAKLKRCICAVPGVRHTFPTHCKTKRYVLAFVVMKQ